MNVHDVVRHRNAKADPQITAPAGGELRAAVRTRKASATADQTSSPLRAVIRAARENAVAANGAKP